MTVKTVQTAYGTLEVCLGSTTSGVVAGNVTINGVAVRVFAYIQPSKNPHGSVPVGAAHVEHVTVAKEGDSFWKPSWKMQEKVYEVALEVFTDLLADPATEHEVKTAKAKATLDSAGLALEQAQAAVREARVAREAAANEYNRLLSLESSVKV